MPLAKKHLRRLESIQASLKEGVDYLLSERVAVCLKGGPATTTLHCVRPLDGAIFYEIEKAIGTKLCYIYNALYELNAFLERERTT